MKILYPSDFYLYDTQTVAADWAAASDKGTPMPWDPTKPIKRWFALKATDIGPVLNGMVKYTFAGQFGFETRAISGPDAMKPNIPPSAANYPIYGIAPTTATSSGIPIDPEYLSTPANAAEINLHLGGIVDLVQRGVVYPADEQRREYQIVVGGVSYNVGQILKQQNALGVGHPGSWSLVNSVPTWTPTVDGPVISGPEVPVACKALTATQSVVQGLGTWHVEDTAGDVPAPVADGGGIAPADLATLLQGAKDSAAIRAWFRIP